MEGEQAQSCERTEMMRLEKYVMKDIKVPCQRCGRSSYSGYVLNILAYDEDEQGNQSSDFYLCSWNFCEECFIKALGRSLNDIISDADDNAQYELDDGL